MTALRKERREKRKERRKEGKKEKSTIPVPSHDTGGNPILPHLSTNNSLLDFPYSRCLRKNQNCLRAPVVRQQVPYRCVAWSCPGLPDPEAEALHALDTVQHALLRLLRPLPIALIFPLSMRCTL